MNATRNTAKQIKNRGDGSPKRSAHDWLFALALVIVTVFAYQPVWHAGFIWDDDDYVTGNWTLRNLAGLKHIWFDTAATPQYYPLVHTIFWLEYHVWKLNPMGYHAVNVLLHALVSILIWRVLKRLELPGAWLAAAIFALHPVNVESVAWVTELKSVLSAVFYFAAAWAYLRFAGKLESKEGGWGWWFLALLLFVCALLSKTVACSLPAALLLVCWWKKGRLAAGDLLPVIPFFIAGLWLGLQTARLEQNHVGASGPEWSFSFAERCLIAGRALWFYAGKLVWPVDLAFIYSRWQINAGTGWQWLFPVAALAVVVALWLARKRIGRGPLVAIFFFVGTLFPALGFLSVFPMLFSFVADHFQYLAGTGIIVLAVGGIASAAPRFWKNFPLLRLVGCGLVLLTLGTLTWRQTRMYADPETLWETTIQRNPQCWLAHNNLGVILLDKGLADEAMTHFQNALAIRPQYPGAYNNLGTALMQKRQINEAIADYQKALQLDPDYAEACNNLGSALLRKGQMDEAMASYQKALQIKPSYAEAHNNLGSALMQKGRIDEAMVQYQKALQINPDYAEAQYNLANAWLQKGQGDQAIIEFQKALQINPAYAEAHNNLGNLLFQKRELDQAIAQYRAALAIKPDDVEAWDNLGAALLQKGQTDEAMACYQKALQTNPDDAESHDLLATVLLQKGRVDEAIAHLQKALALQPGFGRAQNDLAHIAWVLATSPAPSVRNGGKAVELARQADQLSGGKEPVMIATLAAADAEAGNFPEAIADARRALQLAVEQKDAALAAALQQEIKLYEAGTPWRDVR
jgi:tetratricopeptide (TPR) repeat protein